MFKEGDKMNKKIRNVLAGLALMVAGAGITLPLSYNAGFNSGRESAKPVIAKVSTVTNYQYEYLEGLAIIDASGQYAGILFESGHSSEQIKAQSEEGYIKNRFYRVPARDNTLADSLRKQHHWFYDFGF
jgi:hypothetical protein